MTVDEVRVYQTCFTDLVIPDPAITLSTINYSTKVWTEILPSALDVFYNTGDGNCEDYSCSLQAGEMSPYFHMIPIYPFPISAKT